MPTSPRPRGPRAALHRVPAPLVGLLLAAVALGGCGRSVSAVPGPDAADPVCADVTNSLPEEIGDLTSRETDAQATAAWADDAGTVVLRCGVEPLGPTTSQCVPIPTAAGSVDWVQDEEDGTRWTTYGRVPAVELVIPVESEINPVLTAVSPSAELVEQTAACV